MKKAKMNIPGLMEVVFDIFYLTTVLFLGIYFLFHGTSPIQRLYGSMAVVLGGGDSFHLLPRIGAILSGNIKGFQKALGLGKMITSITMTLFYLMLWHVGITLVAGTPPIFTYIIYILSALRMVLCLFSQNGWTSTMPSLKWGIYRNIPFFILGLMVMVFFSIYASVVPPSMRFMGLAIFLSFLFYLPVVLFSHKNPKVGMLMLPKTCAYLWIVSMGFGLF